MKVREGYDSARWTGLASDAITDLPGFIWPAPPPPPAPGMTWQELETTVVSFGRDMFITAKGFDMLKAAPSIVSLPEKPLSITSFAGFKTNVVSADHLARLAIIAKPCP